MTNQFQSTETLQADDVKAPGQQYSLWNHKICDG